MKILSINTYNNSLDFKLFNMDNETTISYGKCSHIGDINSNIYIKYGEEEYKEEIVISDYNSASKLLIEKLLSLGIVSSIDDIDYIGHFINNGSDKYIEPIIINDDVLNNIRDIELNNDSVLGIEAFKELMPNKIMVAVFDTSFHNTIDKVNYLYPIPIDWYRKYNIRKYGYNGISHSYITSEVNNIMGDKYKLISVDLDKDSSVCAILDGKSINTSMGFRHLGGAMSGTSSGNIDPSIIPYIMEKEGKNAGEIINDLTNTSGLVGISELSSDMSDIVISSNEGNEESVLAKNMYVKSIVDYIGSYYLLLGGCDIIVFSSSIGEKEISIRREICEKLGVLGVKIDLDLNQNTDKVIKISTEDSKIQVYVIPNNKELMVARETMNLVRNGN